MSKSCSVRLPSCLIQSSKILPGWLSSCSNCVGPRSKCVLHVFLEDIVTGVWKPESSLVSVQGTEEQTPGSGYKTPCTAQLQQPLPVPAEETQNTSELEEDPAKYPKLPNSWHVLPAEKEWEDGLFVFSSPV